MEYIGNKKKQGSIVELLRDEILAGNIPDGSEMTQNELAEGLGVSRMPVREALILLEYQGLIDRLEKFSGFPQEAGLPSAPKQPYFKNRL